MEYTSPAEIETWIAELNSLVGQSKCNAPRFIKPFHLATLAHKMRLRNLTSLVLPEKIAPYANNMKLWEALNIPAPGTIATHTLAGRHHPIEVLRNQNTVDKTADDLVRLVEPVCKNEQTINAVNTMLRELVDNCYSHADVPDGIFGLLCAQVWAGGGKAQISIADTGVGIRNSLSLNEELHPRLASENACEMATEYGVTGKPGKGHSGYGLNVARRLIEQNNGSLIVRSGNEGYCVCGARPRRFKTENEWHGTLLVIEWDLNGPMNIREVYDSFPLPEGMTNDDFNFDF